MRSAVGRSPLTRKAARAMLSPDEKKAHVWIHEDHHSPVRREEGGPLRAGIFLLEGRYHVAAHTSPFERRLREQGALHVANLVFEPELAEHAVPADGPELRPVAPRRAVEAFHGVPSRN